MECRFLTGKLRRSKKEYLMIKFILLLLFLFSFSSFADDPKPSFGAYVSMGQIAGWENFRRFGENADVDTADLPEDIWATGGAYPWPTSAQATTLVSADADDTAAGTGCRTVRLTYMGEDYVQATQDVTLNGASIVTADTDVYRINSAECISSGSSEANEGIISIKHGATTIGTIPVGAGGTLKGGIFSVPAGKSMLANVIRASILKNTSGAAEVALQIKRYDTQTWRTIKTFGLDTAGSSSIQYDLLDGKYERFLEKTDVRARVTGATSSNLSINFSIDGYLVDDTLPSF